VLLRPDRQSQIIGVNYRLTGFVEETNFQRVHARFLNFVKTLQIYGEYANYAGRNRETNCAANLYFLGIISLAAPTLPDSSTFSSS